MSHDEDTRPVLTPTVERRIREIEQIVGEFKLGAKALLARAIVRWRADDYAAGKDGNQLSQTLPAVRVPEDIKK